MLGLQALFGSVESDPQSLNSGSRSQKLADVAVCLLSVCDLPPWTDSGLQRLTQPQVEPMTCHQKSSNAKSTVLVKLTFGFCVAKPFSANCQGELLLTNEVTKHSTSSMLILQCGDQSGSKKWPAQVWNGCSVHILVDWAAGSTVMVS